MLYVAYLDEFGHVGPFVARTHPQHNDSPVFGLAGMLLPADQIRNFATAFYQLKCRLLRFEIARAGVHPARWEKKGAALFTTQNVTTYPELRRTTFRLVNHLQRVGGHLLFVGVEKRRDPRRHDPKRLYLAVLRETLKRLNHFGDERDSDVLLVMDEHPERHEVITQACMTMYGHDDCQRILEPPFAVESHRYQTCQCADWVSGLIGRWTAYQSQPEMYADWAWTQQYFGTRLHGAAVRSGIRRIDSQSLLASMDVGALSDDAPLKK